MKNFLLIAAVAGLTLAGYAAMADQPRKAELISNLNGKTKTDWLRDKGVIGKDRRWTGGQITDALRDRGVIGSGK